MAKAKDRIGKAKKGTAATGGVRKAVTAAAGVVAAAGVAVGVAALVSRGHRKGWRREVRVLHVQHDGKRWEVRAEGAAGPASAHDTKKEATAAGRELARAEIPSRLVIHRLDGAVLESHDYGEDG